MADLTMQEIDGLETYALTEIRVCGPTVEVQISGKELFKLCHYARRGVEADDRLTHLEEAYQSAMRVGSEAQQRAEKAEAELAAIKAALAIAKERA